MNLFNPAPTIATEKKQAMDYDQFQERVHGMEYTSMRNCIVDSLSDDLEDKMRVLDCGTGTGDIAIRIANKFLRASVVGIDASCEYLNIFSKKITNKGLDDRVSARKIDLNSKFSDDLGIFDRVVSQYVFHYKFNRVMLFSEIYKALEPSGILIFGVTIPVEDQSENTNYFIKIEENSHEWHREHGYTSEESRRNAKRDKLWLMTYCNMHATADHLLVWLNDLRTAGFATAKCLWRVSMDTVILANKSL